MPFFPWVALTFFSLSRFVIEFLLFSTVWDLFGPLWEWWLIICYFGLISPFLGSSTHFSWVTPTFLPPNSFLTWFFIFSRKKKGRCGSSSGQLTPKTSLWLGLTMREGLANPHWQFITTLTSKKNDTKNKWLWLWFVMRWFKTTPNDTQRCKIMLNSGPKEVKNGPRWLKIVKIQ